MKCLDCTWWMWNDKDPDRGECGNLHIRVRYDFHCVLFASGMNLRPLHRSDFENELCGWGKIEETR